MKKWIKCISAVGLAIMLFAAAGMKTDVKAYVEDEILSISASYEGKAVPYEADIDPDDFEIIVRWYDGNKIHKDEIGNSPFTYTISPDTMESKNYENVKVFVHYNYYDDYELKSGSVTDIVRVKCAPPTLTSIEAEYKGDNLLVDGEIDEADVEVIAYYDDGSKSEVTGWEFDSYDLTEGSNNISLYYEEEYEYAKATITVWAYEGEISGISASYYGGKVPVGGTISRNNIVVKGIYDSDYGNVYQTLDYGWSMYGYTINEGNNSVTISYRTNGKTYTDTINVKGYVPNSGSTASAATANTWLSTELGWKYILGNGTYAANQWIQSPDSGLWYWMDANGYMVSNQWHNDAGTWYWLGADGSMAKGWVLTGGQWYFMDEVNGNMRVGWKWWNGKCYYLDPVTGAMATNRWVGDYYVDADGAWTLSR